MRLDTYARSANCPTCAPDRQASATASAERPSCASDTIVTMRTWGALNIAGLVLTTGAAALMWYYPPRGTALFDDDGGLLVTWKASPTEEGKRKARRQRVLSRAAPATLAAGFALQLVGAVLAA